MFGTLTLFLFKMIDAGANLKILAEWEKTFWNMKSIRIFTGAKIIQFFIKLSFIKCDRLFN